MRLSVYPPDDAQAFADRATPFLCEREVENCLMLGLLATPAPAADARRYLIDDGDRLVAAAVQTRPLAMVVTRLPPGGIDVIAEQLAKTNWAGQGFSGPLEAVDALAAAWLARRADARTRCRTALRLFQITKVIDPPAAAGEMIPAAAEHLEVLAEWHRAFHVAINEPVDDPLAGARRLLERASVYFWRDGSALRSMAAVTGPTPRGIRINHVYTPPEFRAQGYASNLVAAVSRHQLTIGRKFCTLFTDLTNPTSNKIYRQIGYRPVRDCAHWMWEGAVDRARPS
jgi:GNAT superfamily N-acetyltransferase